MGLNIELLQSSFELVKPSADELVDRFYDRLFRDYPEVRPLFPEEMGLQKGHLLASLVFVVENLRSPERLTTYLQDLGLRHVNYGVEPKHYPAVGRTLLATLAEVAGDAWTDELQQAWADAYAAIQSIIFEALQKSGHAAA